ncbi:MAG TPA: hypothetical protein VFV53_08000, partial [Candidatus Limnocylindrales bacterium]|nr:hypothetical protein [Candidatus Limnocylindrales bacterium]
GQLYLLGRDHVGTGLADGVSEAGEGGGGLIPGGLALAWTGPVVAIGLAVLIVIAAQPRRAPPDATDDELADEPAA